MRAIRLRTEHMRSPLGLNVQHPLLSWCCEDGQFQTAFQIRTRRNGQTVWESEIQKTDKMHCFYEPELSSRERVVWQVRLWDETGISGQWSEEAVFELGITAPEEWCAAWIDPETDSEELQIWDAINRKAKDAWEQKQKTTFVPHKPASYLRKGFQASPGEKNRLYITCKGIYRVWLNGMPVGNYCLAPGPAVYPQYIPFQTYDVGPLLREGENEMLVALGDGWYRSCSGVNGDRNLYGDRLAMICQVMTDDQVVCCSDGSWQASQSGPIRQNDLQQGEVYDARMESIAGWHGVTAVSRDHSLLRCDSSVPIAAHEAFPGVLITTPNGETVVDFGQNLAGTIELTVEAKAGQRIFLQCGETLDENGNFTQENFQDRKRHSENGTHQMIEYICKEGFNQYTSSFTIMGFRYARLETEVNPKDIQLKAYAVYSCMEQTGTFTCGNDLLNRLVENAVWSQKGNFCGIPTDCPTRERAGWTGDAGIFVETGLDLMDSYPVFAKWLGDCRCLQHTDGRVTMIAPAINRPGMMTDMLAGSAGWGDAAILVPWVMYLRTGDLRILEENYAMMQRWYGYLEGRTEKGKVKKLFQRNPWKEYLICSGLDYGEWCESGIDNIKQMMAGNHDVATAYLAYSGKILSQIAGLLGYEKDADHYRQVSQGAANAYREAYTDNGKINSQRQCQYIRPLHFGLLPEAEQSQAAQDLNDLVKRCGYHLNTGFLTTAYLCQTLAQFGYTDTTAKVLLQETCPGWLYEVKQGATTIWETWDGVDESGKVKASLNHYSYGAVVGWLIRGVCGIRQEGQDIRLEPLVLPQLGFAKAVYASPVGVIESGWRFQTDGTVEYEFQIPVNTQAVLILKDQEEIRLQPGRHAIKI